VGDQVIFADKCYRRFDRNFQCFPNQNSGREGLSQSDSKAYLVASSDPTEVFLSETSSIQGSYYNNSLDNQFTSSAICSDSSWFVNSGSTNHITSNLHNLTLHSPYQGLTVGNGKKLSISNVGFSQLYTQNRPYKCFSACKRQ